MKYRSTILYWILTCLNRDPERKTLTYFHQSSLIHLHIPYLPREGTTLHQPFDGITRTVHHFEIKFNEQGSSVGEVACQFFQILFFNVDPDHLVFLQNEISLRMDVIVALPKQLPRSPCEGFNIVSPGHPASSFSTKSALESYQFNILSERIWLRCHMCWCLSFLLIQLRIV